MSVGGAPKKSAKRTFFGYDPDCRTSIEGWTTLAAVLGAYFASAQLMMTDCRIPRGYWRGCDSSQLLILICLAALLLVTISISIKSGWRSLSIPLALAAMSFGLYSILRALGVSS